MGTVLFLDSSYEDALKLKRDTGKIEREKLPPGNKKKEDFGSCNG